MRFSPPVREIRTLDAEQALALYDRQDREGYFCALQALLKQYPERSREISVLLSPIDESREQERKNREELDVPEGGNQLELGAADARVFRRGGEFLEITVKGGRKLPGVLGEKL